MTECDENVIKAMWYTGTFNFFMTLASKFLYGNY